LGAKIPKQAVFTAQDLAMTLYHASRPVQAQTEPLFSDKTGIVHLKFGSP
jgi:hypothetical protein